MTRKEEVKKNTLDEKHTLECKSHNAMLQYKHHALIHHMNGPGTPHIGVPGMWRAPYVCVCE